jgi:hypothetical protein
MAAKKMNPFAKMAAKGKKPAAKMAPKFGAKKKAC